jgi:hypothetical protein
MHPLHNYLAQQLADKLKARRVVVWYDPRRDFQPFIDELRGMPSSPIETGIIAPAGIQARLIEYTGSYFEIRAKAEPFVFQDWPDPLLIYIPGMVPDPRGSVLMELELAGERYEPGLKRLAKNVLRKKYTDGVIDDILAPERVGYDDLALASADSTSTEPPSLLKTIFRDSRDNEAILATWLADADRDAEIESKQAGPELKKLVKHRLGLELSPETPLIKLRASILRYVLGGEFRSDLTTPSPPGLDGIPTPKKKEDETALRALAQRLRLEHASAYAELADQVERELHLTDISIPVGALGAIDTFRFEERVLRWHCGELIAARKFEEALALVKERERSFWLDRDVALKALWETCRRMAELGRTALRVMESLPQANGNPTAWIEAYTSNQNPFKHSPWFALDLAQRRLETLVSSQDVDPQEPALSVTRRLYEDTCQAMTEGFARAMVKANWSLRTGLHQTDIFKEMIAGAPKPVAYFMVDAFRYEMGAELVERLPKSAEVNLRPAIGALPGITPIGMAALLPGAAASFSVSSQDGNLGSMIADKFLPNLASRQKFAASQIPGLVDLSLDELLTLSASKLHKKLEGAQVVIVRSQEIDQFGETGHTLARLVMDSVIDNLAKAVRRLGTEGIENSVISADHGHLFFGQDRDESMRIDSPGGETVELHRRCWIGRGGSTPSGCIRVQAGMLGYGSDLDFVFPGGSGVFRSGGDLAYHHGGLSLQEVVIPVLKIRLKPIEMASSQPAQNVVASGLPEIITNRIFTTLFRLGAQKMSLFASSVNARPLLMAEGKCVGNACMSVGGEFNQATGCVDLVPGSDVTIAFLLTDEKAVSIRLVLVDPTTDAEIYRSPRDIPVKLGV